MASTVFNLGGVKVLKNILRFQTSDVQIITGNSADPTVTAVNAVAGSIYIRANGEIYIKNTSGNNTDFRQVSSQDALDAHVDALTDAHDASAISNVPAGNLAATDVQGALNELQSDVDSRALDSAVIKKDGSVAFTANQPMGGFKITGLAPGTASSDAVTKGQQDAALEGLKPKAAVRVATTANITIATALNSGDVIDGVTLANGDRVLVKDQTAAEANGIYVVSATPARSTDFDSLSPIDEINGSLIAVQEGTANAGKVFVQSGAVAVLDTDPINFVFFNSSSSLVGGDGITVSGSNISVDHDGEGLQIVATQLALELDGSTLSKSASGLKLNDTAVTPGSYGSATQVSAITVDQQGRLSSASNTSIAIPASQVTDFNEAAQDAVGTILVDSSKIDFTYDDGTPSITATIVAGSLVNADINASAAIAATKIGNGDVDNTELSYLNGVTSSIQTQLNGKANLTGAAFTGNISTNSSNSLISALNLSQVGASLLSNFNPTSTPAVIAIDFTGATSPGLAVATSPLVGGTTGNLRVQSGNGANTGNIDILSGNATGTTSGAIALTTGTATTRGNISLDAPAVIVRSGQELRFNNTANTFYTSLKAGTNAANLSLTLPIADGSVGQVLQTNGSGVLSFVTPASGYTDEQAQDAVGSILVDSATIDFTYDDGVPSITASVIDASITNAKIATGVDAAKIADGSVSNAEFQYLGGVTSDIQTQLNARALDSVVIKKDGSVAMTNSLDLGTWNIDNVNELSDASTLMSISVNARHLVNESGGNMLSWSGATLNANSRQIVSLADGTAASHAVNKGQLDAVAGVTSLVTATNASMGSNVTDEVITGLTFAHASFNGCEVKYRIKKGTLVRTGTFLLATDGTEVAFNDAFVETVDSTVVFEAVVNGANINIRHTNTETGTMVITFEQKRFAV